MSRGLKSTPPLERGKEGRLFKAWKETGDQAALRDIVESHQPLVKKLAKQFMGRNILLDDLISEGNVGLMRALYKFKPDNGNRLATYATYWIKESMRKFTRRSWSMVRIGTTVAQRKLFSNFRTIKSEMGLYDNKISQQDIQTIAKKMGVKEAEVVDMAGRLSGGDHSLNAPLKMDGEGEWLDWVVNGGLDPEAAFAGKDMRSFRGELLDEAMKTLTKREQEILTERRLSGDRKTLGQLGENYKITRQRVHQIEARAFKKLQKVMVDGLKKTDLRPEELFNPAIDYEKKMAIE
ncbi:MAG: RNA polymerase factor sigma-32 [Proteobacteria bacterium]|nr:RNA polymerase factor sigma-32 [Pseudomonadota bacterium]